MSARKWKQGDARITNLGALLSSFEQFGGVWWSKFRNAESIKSLQLRTVLRMIDIGAFFFPSRIESVNEGRDK